MNKEKDPSELAEWSNYDFSGKISDLIPKLQKIINKHPNATISYSFDYSGCYYEGDTPDVVFTIRSK